MSIPAEAWLIAVFVAVGHVLVLLGLAGLLVRRPWNRADSEKRAEVRSNWREHRKGMFAYLPVWMLVNGVLAFVVTLFVASLTLG